MIERAVVLEREGQLIEAYALYKGVESFYEVNDELRAKAWDGAQRCRGKVEAVRPEIETAIGAYRVQHGRYPSDLADLELSHSARNALFAYHYVSSEPQRMKLEPRLLPVWTPDRAAAQPAVPADRLAAPPGRQGGG